MIGGACLKQIIDNEPAIIKADLASKSVITATINGCEIVLSKPIGIGLFR
jgi:hypothetical protein